MLIYMAFELIEKILARFKLAYAEAKKVSKKQKEENNNINDLNENKIKNSFENNEQQIKEEPEHENLAYPGQN